MEALVLAVGLRMKRTRMGDANTDADQPNGELGVRIARRVAPRPAVVHVHAPRQPVAAKHGDQMRLDRLGALVLTGLKQHRVARVIVEHSQSEAAALSDLKVALKSICSRSLGAACSKRCHG